MPPCVAGITKSALFSTKAPDKSSILLSFGAWALYRDRDQVFSGMVSYIYMGYKNSMYTGMLLDHYLLLFSVQLSQLAKSASLVCLEANQEA